MQRKRTKAKADGSAVPSGTAEPSSGLSRQLWVRPNMNLRPERQATGEGNPLTSANAQKFLKLADAALGLEESATLKKDARSVSDPAGVSKEKRRSAKKLMGQLQ